MSDLRSLQEREYLVAQELLTRRRGDALLSWEPTKDQKPFIESVLGGDRSENWFFAANRSGKTDAGGYCGSVLARFGTRESNPGWYRSSASGVEVRSFATAGLVSGVSYRSMKETVQPKYFDNGLVPPSQSHAPFIPPHEIEKWKAGDETLHLRNGSVIFFRSAEAGRNAYAGGEKDWIHLDEEHPRSVYQEVGMRVGGRKLRLFCTVTLLPPDGMVGGVNWAYNDIVVPWRQGKAPHLGVFTGKIMNNPYISKEEIEILKSRYPEGSIQRRIRLDGELIPGIAGATVYGNFDRALHVVPQPELVSSRPVCWVWDFNVDPMISLMCQREGDLFRVKRELVLEGGSIPEMCSLFLDAFPGERGEVWIYGDATSQRRNANVGKSDYETIMNHMRTYGLVVRTKLPTQNPLVRDRINAMNQALKDEKGERRVEIDPSCEELIADLEEVMYDRNGGIRKVSDRNNPAYRRSHASDALSYWVHYENPIRNTHSRRFRPAQPSAPHYGFQK